MEETIDLGGDADFTPEQTYRLALESVQRWLWRTDDLEPMDVIRQTRKVVATALKRS